MNSKILSKILKKDDFTKKIFEGVFSRDTIPSKALLKKKEYLIVINTDLEKGSGIHWVLVYCNSDQFIYFDSLGPTLLSDKYFDKFVNEHTARKQFNYSPYRLQSLTTSTCGYYCILAALYFARGFNLQYFTNLFNPIDHDENDKHACNFLKSKYDIGQSLCGIF